MQRVLLVVGLVLVAAWVLSVVSCALTPAGQAARLPKRVWLLVTIVLPVVGGALWFALGRAPASPAHAAPRGTGAPAGPSGYAGLSAEERIRRLEEELARLEAEERPDGEPQPGRA